MRPLKQDFIYGFKMPRQTEMDVKRVCSKYKLDYACAGAYDDDAGVVIGIKLPMRPVIGEDVLGKGKAQKFSVERFIQSYNQAREKLSDDKLSKMRKELPVWKEETVVPKVWAISYLE